MCYAYLCSLEEFFVILRLDIVARHEHEREAARTSHGLFEECFAQVLEWVDPSLRPSSTTAHILTRKEEHTEEHKERTKKKEEQRRRKRMSYVFQCFFNVMFFNVFQC